MDFTTNIFVIKDLWSGPCEDGEGIPRRRSLFVKPACLHAVLTSENSSCKHAGYTRRGDSRIRTCAHSRTRHRGFPCLKARPCLTYRDCKRLGAIQIARPHGLRQKLHSLQSSQVVEWIEVWVLLM